MVEILDQHYSGVDRFRTGITFPFEIYCAQDALSWQPLRVTHRNMEFLVHTPNIAGDLSMPLAPKVDLRMLSPAAHDAVQYSRAFPLPMQCDDTNSSVHIIESHTEVDSLPFKPINSVFVDYLIDHEADLKDGELYRWLIEQNEDPLLWLPQIYSGTAEWLLRRAFKNLRRVSRQYRIGSSLEISRNLNLVSFAMKPGMILTVPVGGPSNYTTLSPDINVVSEEDWRNAWISETEAVHPIDLFLNAGQQGLWGDLSASALQAAFGMDLCRYRLWDGLLKSGRCVETEREEANTNPKKPWRYFSSKLQDRTTRNGCSRSIECELPEVFEAIKTLYQFRDDAAHAKPLHGDPTSKQLLTLIGKLPALIDFCDDVLREA